MKRSIIITAALVGSLSAQAGAVDWSSVTGKDVVLFYPGQSSWEWALTAADHSGATKFREGKNCKECHAGEEKTMGDLLVSGKKKEATPIAGKPGFIVANVKFAHDADRLYAHLEFAEGTQPDAKMDPAFATKVTMMLDDGKVAEATRAGCWGACHDDLAGMPSGGGKERSKYLARTRAKVTRSGGGDDLKVGSELARIRSDGAHLEFWQARLNPGKPAVAADGMVLASREESKQPIAAAEAVFANGKWAVTLSRKMAQVAPYKSIAAGKPFTVGFAVHSGHTAHRFHYISFEHTLVLDQGTADFVAAKK